MPVFFREQLKAQSSAGGGWKTGTGPNTWEQEYIDEYNEIWEAVDCAADYLRQLAWMIKGKREHKKQELEGKGKVQAPMPMRWQH